MIKVDIVNEVSKIADITKVKAEVAVDAVFDALAGSSGHRANMLGDFTHVGVGAYRDANGTLWTAHVFAR